jgi:Holliday junction resolvase RusA-like endonuclease
MIQFFIPGTPKGQPRPKAFSRGGHAGVYDPATANEWKQNVRDAAKKCGLKFSESEPLSLTLHFWIARPKGHYGSGKKSHILKPGAPIWATSKPDSDNLAKAVMDALNDCGFWPDDSIVAELNIAKRYTNSRETGCLLSARPLSGACTPESLPSEMAIGSVH